jgi:hypothetical protein
MWYNKVGAGGGIETPWKLLSILPVGVCIAASRLSRTRHLG